MLNYSFHLFRVNAVLTESIKKNKKLSYPSYIHAKSFIINYHILRIFFL